MESETLRKRGPTLLATPAPRASVCSPEIRPRPESGRPMVAPRLSRASLRINSIGVMPTAKSGGKTSNTAPISRSPT